jgi:hypothetical protein
MRHGPSVFPGLFPVNRKFRQRTVVILEGERRRRAAGKLADGRTNRAAAFGVRAACCRFRTPGPDQSGSKLRALQTLRDLRLLSVNKYWAPQLLLPLTASNPLNLGDDSERTL